MIDILAIPFLHAYYKCHVGTFGYANDYPNLIRQIHAFQIEIARRPRRG